MMLHVLYGHALWMSIAKESETCDGISSGRPRPRVEFSTPCGYVPDPRCLVAGIQPIATEVPMLWRQKLSLVVLAVSALAFSGCGHSEEEWQAKLKENQEL